MKIQRCLFFSLKIYLENPKESIVDYLERLKKGRLANLNPPSLLEDTNLNSIFGMLDPSGKGSITFKQYYEGNFYLRRINQFFLIKMLSFFHSFKNSWHK